MARNKTSVPTQEVRLKATAGHILVIRLSAMGDVAMTVPVLSALTRQYPQLKITVLTKPYFEPMFSALDNVNVFGAEVKGRHKGLSGLWKLYQELKVLHIDRVADLHNVLRSKILRVFFMLAGTPFDQIDKGRDQKKALTSATNKIFESLKTSHQRYADVFERSGFPINLSNAHFLSKENLPDKTLQLLKQSTQIVYPSVKEATEKEVNTESTKKQGFSKRNNFSEKTASTRKGVSRALNFKENFHVDNQAPKNKRFDSQEDSPTRMWMGIAPFAAFEGKMYPLPLMTQVIQKLNNSKKYVIFLFGGGEKEEQQLQKLADRFESCVNSTGKLTFPEELALISNLDAMLSMDSGNGHLAAMYGVPVISLWGITHPYAGFYPFGQDANNALLADREKFPLIPTSVYGNKMPKGYEKAMETISPDDVIAKIEHILIK